MNKSYDDIRIIALRELTGALMDIQQSDKVTEETTAQELVRILFAASERRLLDAMKEQIQKDEEYKRTAEVSDKSKPEF